MFQIAAIRMSFSSCVLASGISTHPHDVCAIFVPAMSFIFQHGAITTFSSTNSWHQQMQSVWAKRCPLSICQPPLEVKLNPDSWIQAAHSEIHLWVSNILNKHCHDRPAFTTAAIKSDLIVGNNPQPDSLLQSCQQISCIQKSEVEV